MARRTADAKRLEAFLYKLETNPRAYARFRQDPRRELRLAGLSEISIDTVLAASTTTVLATLIALLNAKISCMFGMAFVTQSRTGRTSRRRSR